MDADDAAVAADGMAGNTRVLVGRDDRLFPEAFQRASRQATLGIEAETIPGGHLVSLADPEGLVDRLIRFEPPSP